MTDQSAQNKRSRWVVPSSHLDLYPETGLPVVPPSRYFNYRHLEKYLSHRFKQLSKKGSFFIFHLIAFSESVLVVPNFLVHCFINECFPTGKRRFQPPYSVAVSDFPIRFDTPKVGVQCCNNLPVG